MKIQTLKEIEHSIGDRAKSDNRKVRLTFYLNPSEARFLKDYASNNDQSISEVVRRLLKKV
ncbi:hypothetical protein, partial [Colwellia sp. BRX8-3]|uniref:hypothetical protein n=1 Tax=Colwellia sp. BRX8-3 TaxID=2759837 RepID=UPI0015F477B2